MPPTEGVCVSVPHWHRLEVIFERRKDLSNSTVPIKAANALSLCQGCPSFLSMALFDMIISSGVMQRFIMVSIAIMNDIRICS